MKYKRKLNLSVNMLFPMSFNNRTQVPATSMPGSSRASRLNIILH